MPGRLRVIGTLLAGVICLAALVPFGIAAAEGGPPSFQRRTGNPCHAVRLRLHCPDLIMSAPADLQLDRYTHPGRVLLRAASSIDNHGRGPMELRARRVGPHRWRIYQAIYDRRGRAHLLRTSAALVYKFVPGERYGYGNAGSASYWKLKHAASFQLWSVGPHFRALARVRTGPKVDYCLRDLFRTAPSGNSPTAPIYPACSQDPGLRTDTLGTSVGWSDVYPSEYPEQWIDVTGLRGRFAFVQEADPNHLLLESNHRNDLSETYVALPSGRVLGHRIAVLRP
jgi:Lysyl oxidase